MRIQLELAWLWKFFAWVDHCTSRLLEGANIRLFNKQLKAYATRVLWGKATHQEEAYLVWSWANACMDFDALGDTAPVCLLFHSWKLGSGLSASTQGSHVLLNTSHQLSKHI